MMPNAYTKMMPDEYADQLYDLLMLRQIIMQNETVTTYEAVNAGILLLDVKDGLFHYANASRFPGFDQTQATRFIVDAISGADVTVGPYIASYYWSMFDQVRELCNEIPNDIESRKYIIQFDKDHCFQSIQILMRYGEINLIATMRSCNYMANLMNDIYLVYAAGTIIKGIEGFTDCRINIMMNVGSLHIYK